MALYIGITIWFFLLLLLGLRRGAAYAAAGLPDPKEKASGKSKSIVAFLALLSFLFLWFLTAFRSSAIGNDTRPYLEYFDLFAEGVDRTQRAELGYQYLNYFIGMFTRDHHAFLIIMATIMYGGAGLYIFRRSRNIAVSICLFYALFFSLFIAMYRQGIAMVIALYGYGLLKNGKRIPAALIFLLASAFHMTALVCFLLFFDLKLLQKRWFVFLLAALCAVFAASGAIKAVVGLVLPRYLRYFNTRYASSGWLAVSYYLLSYLVLYYLVSGSVIADHRPDRVVAANFAFLIFFAAFGYSVNLFTRAGEYFLLIAVTELPNMLLRQKIKHARLLLFGVCTVFLIMFLVILVFRPGWNHLYPYEFWQETALLAVP